MGEPRTKEGAAVKQHATLRWLLGDYRTLRKDGHGLLFSLWTAWKLRAW